MPRTVWINSPDAAAEFTGGSLPAFDPELITGHRADTHLVIAGDDDAPIARASLWWNETPRLEGRRVGAIGHYAAQDEAAARLLLKAAWQRLGGLGCGHAIGPMDGNTWRRYRYLTERGEEAPFWMEPDNHDEWPAHWTAAGFSVMANYFSALNENLDFEDAQVARGGARLQQAGVTVRPILRSRFEKELREIHAVSLKAFPGNFLYTPLPEAEFLAQYASLRDRLRPELVLLAEHQGETVGYVFAVPDLWRAADTVIVKTVAVVPGRAYAGLGTWLVALAQIAARGLGYRRVIHALMHESNISLNLSARYARRFRRYALFARKL